MEKLCAVRRAGQKSGTDSFYRMAGSNKADKMAMMAITARISTRVKAVSGSGVFIFGPLGLSMG